MKTYIAILRGINVSGQKTVPMAELRRQLMELDLKDLKTYIQSGNLVFKSDENASMLQNIIRETMQGYFGFDVPTLVLSARDFFEIIENSPFQKHDITKMHVTFLSAEPDPKIVESLPRSSNPREVFHVTPKAVYVYCPDGYGRTKINNTFFEKKLQVTATTRNWKTCLKLTEMAKIAGKS